MAKKKKKSVTAKTKKSPSGSFVQLGQQVWPIERDVLYRPDRLKYVRKLIPIEGCVFCVASKEEPTLENLCVHKTQHSMVVINKFPYNSGHVLVLPRKHKGQIFDLTEAEFDDLQKTIRLTMRAITETYQPGGMNVGLNHGQVAGAGIPDHLHYHVIPRWAGDLNFFPLIAETKVVVEGIEQTFERLQNFFKSHKEVNS